MERVIEWALTGGLLVSATLLLGGIMTGSTSALSWGIIVLMLTPVARVVVVTSGLLWEREWTFGVISFFVLVVLLLGIRVAGFQAWPHSLPFR
jgi:uncharacterized membrane protein